MSCAPVLPNTLGFRPLLTASTHPSGPSSSVSPPRLALYLVHPPEVAGQVIELAAGLTLGRGPTLPPPAEGKPSSPEGPAAFIAHATVSRRHCAIEFGFGRPLIMDLGSSNGTRVDGAVLTRRHPLAPHNVVRIGDVLAVVDEQPAAGAASTPALPGVAHAVVAARSALERATFSPAPVMIYGETGTGKERVAAELHARSGRQGQYVRFSCAELARELVESQLFGHGRGAFTGATTAQKGLFAAADGGTLFLDEVGELELGLQAKLLRVLQEGEVRPLGSLTPQRVDVRIVAATNRTLADEVERGTFRRDLYARLSFFEVRLPPLRARRQDLLWWVQELTAGFARSRGASGAPLQLKPDVAELLLLHAWPENLRGLDRFVHRALAAGEPVIGRRVLAEVMPELLGEQARSSQSPPTAAPDAALAAERPTREEFLRVYEGSGRNVRATSKHFGKDRRQIYRWLELFGVER